VSQREKRVTWLHTELTFLKKGMCAETLICVLDRAMGEPLEIEERAAASLSGGLINRGYQCGMLWGAALAAGAGAYRRYGPGPRAELKSITTAQRLVASFCNGRRSMDCRDIIGVDLGGRIKILPMLKILAAGKPVGCFLRAGSYAGKAVKVINEAFDGADTDVPFSPVSCSAELARRMGAMDLHVTMSAGLAGGIGLSGGGCGALGAAIWLTVMDGRRKGFDDRTIGIMTDDVFQRFASVAGEDYRCTAVTGRSFDTPAEHAAYLRSGDCENVIGALAAGITGKE
jgi:hypothetical protein